MFKKALCSEESSCVIDEAKSVGSLKEEKGGLTIMSKRHVIEGVVL